MITAQEARNLIDEISVCKTHILNIECSIKRSLSLGESKTSYMFYSTIPQTIIDGTIYELKKNGYVVEVKEKNNSYSIIQINW